MRIKIERDLKPPIPPNAPAPPIPPAYDRAFTSKRNVSIGGSVGAIPPPPPPIEKVKSDDSVVDYFKNNYSDIFGADSLIGKDVIQLNILFGIFSEIIRVRELLEKE
jgi:hypothetical protein